MYNHTNALVSVTGQSAGHVHCYRVNLYISLPFLNAMKYRIIAPKTKTNNTWCQSDMIMKWSKNHKHKIRMKKERSLCPKETLKNRKTAHDRIS